LSRLASFAVFFLVATAVLGGMHAYIWLRLVRDPELGDPYRRALTVLLALAALAVPGSMFLARRFPSASTRLVLAAAFTWLGTAFLLFTALLAVDAVRALAAAAQWLASLGREAGPPADPERRVFLARAAAGSAVLAAGGAAGLGFRTAVSDPDLHEVPVRLERLPRELSGFTLAQITDLHVGPSIGEKHVKRVVELTNAARPDAVVITGDLVDGGVEELRRSTEHLARLRAPQGVYFVTGNHEYYSGAAEWMEELRRYGIRVLRNERVALGDAGPGGRTIELAGVDDWSARPGSPGRWAALDQALGGRDPERPLVLLAHQPRGVPEAVRAGVDLQISGHTHGGQLYPWTLVVGAVFQYFRGLYRRREGEREGQIFVSCGTGYWGPPIRLGAPAEIAKIVLTT
jgi:predicted MPP superfamily phosphohydrolase